MREILIEIFVIRVDTLGHWDTDSELPYFQLATVSQSAANVKKPNWGTRTRP